MSDTVTVCYGPNSPSVGSMTGSTGTTSLPSDGITSVPSEDGLTSVPEVSVVESVPVVSVESVPEVSV